MNIIRQVNCLHFFNYFFRKLRLTHILLDGLGMSIVKYIEYSEKTFKNSIILNELEKAQTKTMKIDQAAKYWEEFVDK